MTTNKISKQEVISRLALNSRLGSNAAAEDVLDHLLAIITENVASGNDVYLGQSFGGFKAATQAAKSGTALGVAYSTPEKTVIKFKPSAKLKDVVAGA